MTTKSEELRERIVRILITGGLLTPDALVTLFQEGERAAFEAGWAAFHKSIGWAEDGMLRVDSNVEREWDKRKQQPASKSEESGKGE